MLSSIPQHSIYSEIRGHPSPVLPLDSAPRNDDYPYTMLPFGHPNWDSNLPVHTAWTVPTSSQLLMSGLSGPTQPTMFNPASVLYQPDGPWPGTFTYGQRTSRD